MMHKGWLAALMTGVSVLQAWDARVLEAEPFVQALAAVAIALPPLSVLKSRDVRLRSAAVVVAAVLLTAARVMSSVRLPELTLAAFFPAILMLLDHTAALRRQTNGGSARS